MTRRSAWKVTDAPPATPIKAGPRYPPVAPMILQLQRDAGNRAVAQLLRDSRCGTAEGGLPAVAQRLIAVNPAGTPHQDYAIMKQVQQLRKHHQGAIITLDAAPNFSTMGPGEKLYIVSHGSADTGDLRDFPTDTLIAALNHHARRPPANFGGIVILSCYGGRAIQATSMAERVARGLTRQGKTVEGAVGFSFGSPEFLASGKSSVLAEDLRAFYTAEDISAMTAIWAARQPTHTEGVLKDRGQYAAATNQTIRNNLLNVAPALSGGQADAWIDTRIKRFKSEVKRIELSLKSLLGSIPGGSVAEKLANFEQRSGPYSRKAARWDALIQQQYRLFHDYYLWTVNTPFASFTS